METIRFNGRATTGFGLGDEVVVPMTPQDAANVSQKPWGAVFVGVSTTVLGAVVGGLAGVAGAAAVIESESEFWRASDRWAGTGALVGGLAGAGLGSALAVKTGKKQQRAAQTLALVGA